MRGRQDVDVPYVARTRYNCGAAGGVRGARPVARPAAPVPRGISSPLAAQDRRAVRSWRVRSGDGAAAAAA